MSHEYSWTPCFDYDFVHCNQMTENYQANQTAGHLDNGLPSVSKGKALRAVTTVTKRKQANEAYKLESSVSNLTIS